MFELRLKSRFFTSGDVKRVLAFEGFTGVMDC